MTPLHTDDAQIRRLDEIIRAMYTSLLMTNEGRHDPAVKRHHLQRLLGHTRRLLATLNPPSGPESESQNQVFDLGD